MLIYNLFIFTVAFLLYLDYVVHKNDVHLVNGETRLSFGNTFLYLALGVIIFFAGFRFEIGYDYTKYLAGYMYDSELSAWEPLFVSLVKIFRHINFGLDIQFMFFFFSALTMMIIYYTLKSITSYYRLGLFLYLLIPSLFLNSFSVIRQGIALAILLYGLQFIAKKNPEYKKYMMVSLVAFLFHYSSIFVVLIFIFGASFFKKVYSWFFYTFLIVISFFLSFSHIGKFVLANMPGHFSAYADNMGFSVSIIKILVVNVFFLFLLSQRDKFVRTKLDKYLFNSIFIGLLIFNIFSDFAFVSRLAQYFLVAEIILVPIYLYSIKDSMMRKMMFVLFLLYYLFNFNYALYRDFQGSAFKTTRDPHALIPYRNYYLEEKKSDRNFNIEAWYNYIQESVQEEENSK